MQFSLDFQSGLTTQFPEYEDCVNHVVYSSRKGLNGVAADLDMSPSELSKRINRNGKGDDSPDNRPLRARDVMRIMDSTRDYRPIYWQIEKYLRDPAARQEQAINQLAQMLPGLTELVREAGVKLDRRKK